MKIQGNGFCFLNAVRKCMMYDFLKFYSHEKVREMITAHLIDHFDDYTQWHGASPDQLVDEASQFFDDRNFNTDIVDIIVQATAAALNIQIKIYRRSAQGNIQVTEIGDANAEKTINLKLNCSERSIRNPTYTGDNHYDSLVIHYKFLDEEQPYEDQPSTSGQQLPEEEEEEVIDLTQIESPSKGDNKVPKRERKISCDDFIDLTDSPVKVPLSHSDTEAGSTETTDTESISVQSDLNERLEFIQETLDQLKDPDNGTDDIETDPGPITHHLRLDDPEREQEIIEQYLRPSTIFPTFLFNRTVPKKVDFLPHNIDGNVYYKVKCTTRNYCKKVSDRRWFYMRTSSRKGLRGIRKVGTCKGSWQCINPECSFLKTEKKANTYHFEYRGGSRACYSCGRYASLVPCGARKMFELSIGSEYAHVYHIGKHTCTLHQEIGSDLDFTQSWLERFPGLSYRELKSAVIQNYLDAGDHKEAESAAYRITNQAFRKLKRAMKVDQNSEEVQTQSLEAVAEVKKASDDIDPFYIYQVNSKKMNNRPDYVMKASSKILQLAIDMDVDGPENPLQLEDAYFDGAHSRCSEFISLGLWVMHPSMRQIIRLASMEVRTEHTDELSIFWILLNEMLAKLTKKPNYKFNPRHILFDEAGANFTSVKGVFGDDFVKQRVVTCQWHFMNKVMERVQKIPNEKDAEEFATKAAQMCRVPTVAEFELLYARLKELCDDYPEVTGDFLVWYYARRSHLFRAFRAGRHSGVNLAEIGNAMWKPRRKLSLVAAAKDDITTMMQQESDLQRFNEGTGFKRGYAPTDAQRATKEKRAQMEEGRSFAEMLQNEAAFQMQRDTEADPPYFMPGAKAKHKPTKKTKGVEGKEFTRKGKGRGKTSAKRTTPSLNEILDQLNRAKKIQQGEDVPDLPEEVAEPQVQQGMPVLGSGPERRKIRPIKSTPEFPNQPHIVHSLWNVSKCQGCPKDIDTTKKAPHDIFFRMKAVRPYQDKATHMWHDKVSNVYFHLNLGCLNKFDPTLNTEEITMTNEMFYSISDVHFKHLASLGILKHIIGNKGKDLQVTINFSLGNSKVTLTFWANTINQPLR